MIPLCYGGSEDARTAIAHAGDLFDGTLATVLTVWEPFSEVLARTYYGFGMAMVDVEEIDAASRDGARSRAAEGAELARAAGLDAQPRTCAREGMIARAILMTADDLDASAIVVGSRGLGSLRSLLLGSGSHELLQHPDGTVIVVPSATVAAARTRRLEHDDGHAHKVVEEGHVT